MYSNLLLAFNDSALARRALATAIELARRLNVPLRVVVVDESLPTSYLASAFATADARVVEDAMSQEAAGQSALAREVRTAADAAGVRVAIDVVQGDEVSAIGDAVERYGSDLLVVGLRPYPGLVDRLTRGVADRVGCSVLAVR